MTSTPMSPGRTMPGQGVHVGPVHVEEAALGVDDLGDLPMSDSKTPRVLGLVTMRAATSSVIACSSAGQVDRPVLVGLDLLDRVAADVGRRRVRAVGRIGDEDVLAGVRPAASSAARTIIMPVSSPWAPAAGWSVKASMPAISQSMPSSVFRTSRSPWTRSVGGAAGGAGEARVRRQPLVDLGVVFHRAGAERIDAHVDAVVLLGEAGEVAGDLGLGDLGEAVDLLAERDAGERRPSSRGRPARAARTPACRAR